MKVVVSEFMDTPGLAALRAVHEVVYEPSLVDDAARLRMQAGEADAFVVRNRTQVRGELLDALVPRCRVVGRLGVGLDNIDVAGCRTRGIAVAPATGANARAVAEYVLVAAAMLLRRCYFANERVIAGEWPREALSGGREIGGKTLGLVGFGSIGRVTAQMARAWQIDVIATDAALSHDDPAYAEAGVRGLSLEALVAEADIVSLHVPLADSTRNLFDAARVAAMKPGAILVNASRGGIVDETALVAALKRGHLGGAALDTFAEEPLRDGSAFAECPNLLLTPHTAGPSAEANARVSISVAEQVLAVLAR